MCVKDAMDAQRKQSLNRRTFQVSCMTVLMGAAIILSTNASKYYSYEIAKHYKSLNTFALCIVMLKTFNIYLKEKIVFFYM